MATRKKTVVKKVSPAQADKEKNDAFLKLKPADRLKAHEQLRKRIWGDQYNKTDLEGLKVRKKKSAE